MAINDALLPCFLSSFVVTPSVRQLHPAMLPPSHLLALKIDG